MGNLTHYVFKSVWEIEAPFDALCRILADVETYPDWWAEIHSVRELGPGRFEMTARSLLPYSLRFVSENRAQGELSPGVIDARLTGDLEGFARWTVESQGESCRLVYDQEVDTHKALLNKLAPVARPAFKANHALMMKHGESGLRTYTAGYLRALRGSGGAG